MKILIVCLVLFVPLSLDAQVTGGGQTKANESGWTVDTLNAHWSALAAKDHEILMLHQEMNELRDKHATDLRDAADKRYDQRFNAQEAAQTSYKTASNEFRGTLSDQARTFVSKSELSGYITTVILIMGVLVAWLSFSSRRRAKPAWVDELITELRAPKAN